MNKSIPIKTEEADKLLSAKISFGQLFRFLIDHAVLILRPLSIAESESIVSLSDQISDYNLHEWIVSRTTIYCSDSDYVLNSSRAGMLASVAIKIMSLSNIRSEDGFKLALGNKRKSSTTLQSTIESLIGKAFPSLSPIDLKNLTQEQQITYLTKAESLLGTKLELDRKPSRRRGPKVPEGFSSVGGDASSITSPQAADIPDFERDNKGMM